MCRNGFNITFIIIFLIFLNHSKHFSFFFINVLLKPLRHMKKRWKISPTVTLPFTDTETVHNLSNYFIIYGKFDLFIKKLNFSDHLEKWWRHQKSHVTLITILVFFEDLVTLMQSFIARTQLVQDLWWGAFCPPSLWLI